VSKLNAVPDEKQGLWDGDIFIGWATVAVVAVNVGFYICLPRLTDQALAVSLASAPIVFGGLYRIHRERKNFSRAARYRHIIAIVLSLVLCATGVIYVVKRLPSGNIYGLNLWIDGGFNRAQNFVFVATKTLEVPEELVEFACEDPTESPCISILFSGYITNDTAKTITAVGFSESVYGHDYPLAFQWSGHCYNSAITLAPRQTEFVGFVIPEMPLKIRKQYAAQNDAPMMQMITPDSRISIINKEDKPALRKQTQDQRNLVAECADAYKGEQPGGHVGAYVNAQDSEFIVDLIAFGGVHVDDVRDVQDAVAQAKSVCAAIANDQSLTPESGDALIPTIQRWRPDMPAAIASRFISQALVSYCRDQADRVVAAR
jgi:hypothetical protein